AERVGVLLVDDGGARAEPETLDQEPLEGRAIVDRDVVLRAVRCPRTGGRSDGVPAPREVAVAVQALDELLEVVARPGGHRLRPGAVEVELDQREVSGEGPPRVLDGVTGTGDGEGPGEREILVEPLHPRASRLRGPVGRAARFGQERVADGALV